MAICSTEDVADVLKLLQSQVNNCTSELRTMGSWGQSTMEGLKLIDVPTFQVVLSFQTIPLGF